jgi:hypothetical protein
MIERSPKLTRLKVVPRTATAMDDIDFQDSSDSDSDAASRSLSEYSSVNLNSLMF